MPNQATTIARRRRLARGMTMEDLAKECAAKGAPVDISQISRIETGQATPRPKLRSVLAEILGIDVSDLEARQKAGRR
jgi:transcriptional regulator with XRE-family HTH domain